MACEQLWADSAIECDALQRLLESTSHAKAVGRDRVLVHRELLADRAVRCSQSVADGVRNAHSVGGATASRAASRSAVPSGSG
jgi:hypothetical protein